MHFDNISKLFGRMQIDKRSQMNRYQVNFIFINCYVFEHDKDLFMMAPQEYYDDQVDSYFAYEHGFINLS
jgi:hypothetical protein